MSLIFEALQRAEQDLAGAEPESIATATDLLRNAEFHASRAWEQELPAIDAGSSTVTAGTDWPVVMDSRELEKVTVPLTAISPQIRLATLAEPESPAAENFRFLGVRLRHMRRERPLQKVLITSTSPHEGKSVVAANLACVLARKKQQRTLLIEGDLRRPSQGEIFGMGDRPGITDWLRGSDERINGIYKIEHAGLWVLPAGKPMADPLELLQSARLSALMKQLSGLFDWIVIDTPPILPLGDASVWSQHADGIILVARQGMTQKRKLENGLKAIDQDKLISALLNCSQDASLRDHYDYYYSTAAADADRA